MFKFKGLVAATFTPMNADGSIALDKVPEIVDYAV
jgi:dihydrodipicolinate synthase/N-acetylneuraminate lyase